MKKIKRYVLVVVMATLALGTIAGTAKVYGDYKFEQMNRAYLLDFIHYCQGNEGLRQINPSKDYTKSSTHDLKHLAKFYLEQDNFADVSDYWDIKVIDEIVK